MVLENIWTGKWRLNTFVVVIVREVWKLCYPEENRTVRLVYKTIHVMFCVDCDIVLPRSVT